MCIRDSTGPVHIAHRFNGMEIACHMPLTTRGQSPPEKEKSRTSRQSMPRRPAIHAPYSTWYLSTASVSHMAHIYLTTLPAPCQPEISGATIICIKRQFYLLLSIYIVLLRAEQKSRARFSKRALQNICAQPVRAGKPLPGRSTYRHAE